MAKGKKLHGAANRIYRALQHNLMEQQRLGHKKHFAKQEAREEYLKNNGNLKGYNPAKVDGVYSYGTTNNYFQVARGFSQWAADQGCKSARDITRELAGQYLQDRQARGLCADTVSRDISGLNKIFNYGLNKAEFGLEKRSLKKITRCRHKNANDNRNFSKYNDQMTLAKATGCRRESITNVCPENFFRSASGKVVGVRFTEKAGKTRIAPVLNDYKDILTEVVDRHATAPGKPLFDAYDSHIRNHIFRAAYASSLMKQLEEERAAGTPLFGGDFDPNSLIHIRGKDAATDGPYRGHDRDICAMVSGALGHNRLEVAFSHYNYIK